MRYACDLASGPATLRYNGQGRLVEVVTASGVSIYGYDPIGRRTWKQVRTPGGEAISLTRYIWAGTLLLSEEPNARGRTASVENTFRRRTGAYIYLRM